LPGARTIKDYWSDYKKSIAFAYAANSILVDKNGTLLDLICKGSTSWRKHKTLFSTWMSRTRFVAEHVLSQCSEVETAKETMSYLPEIEAEPFPGPRFDGGQAEKIAQKFERKRKSRS
jgi:hypothetical protein